MGARDRERGSDCDIAADQVAVSGGAVRANDRRDDVAAEAQAKEAVEG